MKRILIIAAHPDDEILGVGGTAIKHIKDGDEVYCLILSKGITSRLNSKEEEIEILNKECLESSKIIGFNDIRFADFPDNKFDSVPLLDIIKVIEENLEKIGPEIVYTHNPNDVNIDHNITYNAVITACRPCNKTCPEEIYSFEILSSTEWQTNNNKTFNPNVFIDIKDEIEDKIKAMHKYKSEIRQYPNPRSEEGIKILAKYRGLQSGLLFAEAFRLERKIR